MAVGAFAVVVAVVVVGGGAGAGVVSGIRLHLFACSQNGKKK